MAKMMKREPGRDGGESLEATEDRFKRWRASRQRGARIPMTLWAAAVALAEPYGVERIAQALRVGSGAVNEARAACGWGERARRGRSAVCRAVAGIGTAGDCG